MSTDSQGVNLYGGDWYSVRGPYYGSGTFDPSTVNATKVGTFTYRELRDEVARRLANATNGWTALAVGLRGRVGIKLGAPSEEAATKGAMQDCVAQDRDCQMGLAYANRSNKQQAASIDDEKIVKHNLRFALGNPH